MANLTVKPQKMAPSLSKSQRTELQSIIIGKFKGEEVIRDKDIATIVPCSTTNRPQRSFEHPSI
ncbi:hypothetical protein J3F84DRAFT_386168 [Trichoderma pleuroticola]